MITQFAALPSRRLTMYHVASTHCLKPLLLKSQVLLPECDTEFNYAEPRSSRWSSCQAGTKRLGLPSNLSLVESGLTW